MSKGGNSQTTRTEPPAYQLPYLQRGMQEASNLYDQGNRIAGFTPYQQEAQQMTARRAVLGDPTIKNASNYVTNTLSGGFMNGNPWLDETFNKAALATQGQLASQFAGAGRNVDQSQGLRAQQLNDLATGIYGGAYENERNRMQGVLPYAQQLGNQGYTDAQALMGIGNQQQQLAQQQFDAPGTALNEYMARINSNIGSTTTQKGPSQGFSGGGAIGGAAMGSLLGPWGALAGGLLGGFF